MVAEALGGRLVHTDHPGEGVVIDLAFRRLDATAPSESGSYSGVALAVVNDDLKPQAATAPAKSRLRAEALSV